MREQNEKELQETYSAQMMWILARAVYGLAGAEFDMPQYVELINPKLKKKQTAQEIKDHVINRLLEG